MLLLSYIHPCFLQGLKCRLLQWSLCWTNASSPHIPPCTPLYAPPHHRTAAPQDCSCLTPHHPFALPNLLLSPEISGLSCCTFSTITPKGPRWWQIPKSGHTAHFPRLWNCVTHQREEVPCLIQNGTCSFLGVPSLLTQRSRSSIPWSKAIAPTASLACVYRGTCGIQAPAPAV